MSHPPKAVSAYMAEIGAKGGAKGGKSSGPRKARSAEHYAKMVEARRRKQKAGKNSVTVDGEHD